MAQLSCPHCGKALESMAGAAFCPYCGGAVNAPEKREAEPEAVLECLRQADQQKEPQKKWELLTKAEAQYPDSLAIAKELLFLGRLHERNSREVDFSVIKSYLWMLYLKPEEVSPQKQAQMREELFSHPRLEKCMALSPNGEAFLRSYLVRLAVDFIRLFLRGDSRYMRRLFGFGLDSRAPKLLADPVGAMLLNIRQDTQLPGDRRDLLGETLYEAFSQDMAGETQWLDAALQKAGINPPRA